MIDKKHNCLPIFQYAYQEHFRIPTANSAQPSENFCLRILYENFSPTRLVFDHSAAEEFFSFFPTIYFLALLEGLYQINIRFPTNEVYLRDLYSYSVIAVQNRESHRDHEVPF